jgi:RNA binding exosome subunit
MKHQVRELTAIDEMLKFLPETVTIAKTPLHVFYGDEIKMETVELKTRDIVQAFLSLQRQAAKEACKIEKGERLKKIIERIKSMSYFRGRP